MGRTKNQAWPEPAIKEAGMALTPATVTGTVERMVPGGWSLLRDDKGVVLARGGIAGEQVVVEIDRKRGGTRQGHVVGILSRSKTRIAADCDVFDRCGGCDLLDHSVEAEADAKRSMVEDALLRIARLDDDTMSRVLPMKRPKTRAGLRRRARIHFDDAGMPGFFARGSHEVVLAGACPALAPDLNAVLADLTEVDYTLPGLELLIACDDEGRVSFAVTGGAPNKEAERFCRRATEAGLCTGALVRARSGRSWKPIGAPTLYGEIAPGVRGGPFRSDAATFTQATRFSARAILDAVVLGARGDCSVIELFAGAGHLSLALAERGHRVVAVESEAHAAGWLRENAQAAPYADKLTALRARVGSAAIDDICAEHGPFDVLVVDPPRTGVDAFEGVLRAADADQLVMVSCDVATGARDIAVACKAGYRLEWMLPIDAFPRTSHVEWVTRLVRD